ncbi:nucleotidyl transferase AbiEii/AbiGii toxin family protein [Scytonema sp. NUACC26]|uniref:nucleotidyl transferase AbiEii/AbiGii toxin family protein n=1 Tax=Scytonema sp. NUACC26 TaxID=3140176 RepID=UPI0034DC94CA
MNNPQITLDLKAKQILTDLKVIMDSLQVPMLLIGARARLLIFDSQYNLEGRATTDWDVAVKLDNWNQYNELRSQMTSGKIIRFKQTSVVHKFIHIETGLEVDVIPFGNISDENQEITWQDGNRMNTLGLEEAFSNTEVEKIDNFEIRIADICSFVALKLLAWNERRESKDLEDIVFVLKNYQVEERVYEELIEEISTGDFDVDEASIILLGRDISKVFRDKTINKINLILIKIIEKQNQVIPQFVKSLEQNAWDEEFYKIVRCFQALQYGLEQETKN